MQPRLLPGLAVSILLAVAVGCTSLAPKVIAQTKVTSPEEFFGHAIGADRKLARWDKMADYFKLLDQESDRLEVVDLGPSTEGARFLMVMISSPENLARAERLAEISRTLADPRGVPDSEIESMIAEGKVVVVQSLGLHSSEVAGTQSGAQIAWDMVSRDDAETRRILDETVLLLLPNINPDGGNWIADWYHQWVGTEYEGAGLPWLYQTYAGHDNNRDGDYMNLLEARYIGRVLYRDWKPQAYIDHHQMGSYGARMVVPPYSEPIRPYADPLLWRELSWYGAHIAYKLEAAGKKGILNYGQYPGWGHFGWHWITPFHNIAGMLTESASATLATPLFIHPDQLRGGARNFPEYEPQSNIPSLWEGGWWRVRDIVEQQVVAARALQDHAARNRETVLRNMVRKARRQTERGATGDVRAYVIPADQHDRLTAVKLVNTLMLSDIEIQVTEAEFRAGGRVYDKGSYVVSMAQPKMGLVRNLLGRTFYPDNTWTRARDGSPLRPYDSSTHTMSEFMGVRVEPVSENIEAELRVLSESVRVEGSVAEASRHRLDGRLNASFKAANLLLAKGIAVSRATETSGSVRPGDFIVDGGATEDLREVAVTTGVDFHAVGEVSAARELNPRIGMYRRYRGGNMDEGWTSLLLEQFSFAFTSLRDEAIKAGDLNDSYDVIILPHDSSAAMIGEDDQEGGSDRTRRGERGRRRGPVPPKYKSGMGLEGVDALRAFVKGGGTLVTIGGATEFGIKEFELSVRNTVTGVPSTEFFCPGSTLRVNIDNSDEIAWGMPKQGLALFWQSPVFEISSSRDSERYRRVVTYAKRDILQSGWLLGEEHLSNKAAVVCAAYGEGEVVLIGIRAQHRAQTDGTYKLFFNALMR